MKNLFLVVIIALSFTSTGFTQNQILKTNYLYFSLSSRFEPMYFSVNEKVSKVDSFDVNCSVDNITLNDVVNEGVDIETLMEKNGKISFFFRGVFIYTMPVSSFDNYVDIKERKKTGETVVSIKVQKDTIEMDTWIIHHLQLD